MTESFVTFEIAKKLKDIGFECKHPFAMYNECGIFHALFTSADYYTCESGKKYREYYAFEDFDEHDYICPTISQGLKWLRKEKQIYVSVEVEHEEWFEYKIVNLVKNTRMNGTHVYETYEKAIISGIEYVLDNLI